MNPVAAQQVAPDNALVAPGKRLKINTIKNIRDTDAYRFKLEKQKCRIDNEVFHEILQICPRLPNQDFVESPSEDEMVSYIKDLGYTGKCASLGRQHDLIGSGHQELKSYEKYGALIPEEMINQDIKDSKAYKTYFDFATGKATPKKARKDTPGVSVSKKKAPAKVDRGKGINLLSDVALLEATQLKQTLKKSKQETHKIHASSSYDGVGHQQKVPDEHQDKTVGTNEGTSTIPRVPHVPKYQSKSENESWGDSEDNDSNDDDSDDVSKDDDDVDSDTDGDNEASDSERTDFDKDENPNLNQNDDDDEEEDEEEYVCTTNNYEFSDDNEEYEELYKDVNVRLKDPVHKEEGKGDAEMTNAGHDEKSYEQVEDDAHVTLIATHVTQKTEVVSMMNVKVHHEKPSTQTPSHLTVLVTLIPETSTATATTVPLTIPPFTLISQQSTPTPAPTTEATTSPHALLNFSSLFGFDQRVSALEQELSRFKQSYTTEFEKETQAEKDRYIDLIEKSIKDIIKDKVKSQLPQILPKEVSDFATLVIQSTIKNVVLDKSSSQPKSSYEAATSLTEFELKKIFLDKMQKSKSYRAAPQHRELYDGMVKSYKLDKDLFETYSKAYSIKRDYENKDKDEDPIARSDQWLKKRKTSKDVEPSKGSTSTESKSSSSKGTKSQPKSSGKSAQAEESVFEAADTEMPHNQGCNLGNTDDQPNVKAASEHEWFKKPERPPTLDSEWNARKSVDFRPPQTWISRIA
ncbi:hypothetical protein Tco_1111210 [Tanacetum coccineum]|uniref:Uncharacterized protein n=1 Tax=Tanacetum coccineum TaxID=301880 RepID=A0ABQ5INC3_9ASTR